MIIMPNWCSNSVKIFGEDLLKFFEVYERKITGKTTGDTIEEKLDFISNCNNRRDSKGFMRTYIPSESKEGSSNDKNIEELGTKWDIYFDDISFESNDEDTLSMYYDTAWSPNYNFWVTISSLFNIEIEMNAMEGGVGIFEDAFIYDGKIEITDMERNHLEEGQKLTDFNGQIYIVAYDQDLVLEQEAISVYLESDETKETTWIYCNDIKEGL